MVFLGGATALDLVSSADVACGRRSRRTSTSIQHAHAIHRRIGVGDLRTDLGSERWNLSLSVDLSG